MEQAQEKRLTEDYNRITHGVIWKELILYVLPLIFGTFFQQLYNTVDAVVVGRFVGKEALSAVGGTSGIVVNIFVGFFVGVSSGAGVVVAQQFGAGNEKNVSDAVHTSIAISILSGIVLTIVGLLIARPISVLMQTPADVLPGTVTYLSVYFIGMVPNLIYNMGSGILRATGDSKNPLYFLIITCILNIILDLLFVLVHHMGVLGVAIATILCQLVSAALVIFTLLRVKNACRLRPEKLRVNRKQLSRILAIGLPAGVQSLMYTLSNMIIQTAINSFGTDPVAAWTAYGKLDSLYWMMCSSFGVAITTFVGQNYGARQYQRVRSCIRQCFLIVTLTTLVMVWFFYVFGGICLQLFTEDQEVLRIGTEIIHFMVPFFITYTAIEVLSGSLRGMGDAMRPMIIDVLGICVLRIIWIFVAVPMWPSVRTVIASYPITWITTSILFLIYYFWYIRKHHIGTSSSK